MSKSILVLAAFEPELKALRERLPQDDRIIVSEIGVGLVESAIRTTRILQSFLSNVQSPHIFFVGSVGSFSSEIPLLALANISAVSLCDLALARGEGYLPAPMSSHFQASSEGLARIDQALTDSGEPILGTAYTLPSITSSIQAAAQYQNFTQASFESMELFGVAAACSNFSLEWNALCPVTNVIGPDAHKSWQENHLAASEKLAKLFIERIVPEFVNESVVMIPPA